VPDDCTLSIRERFIRHDADAKARTVSDKLTSPDQQQQAVLILPFPRLCCAWCLGCASKRKAFHFSFY
jgi:hypothetical protein